jgi:hypothetical protein
VAKLALGWQESAMEGESPSSSSTGSDASSEDVLARILDVARVEVRGKAGSALQDAYSDALDMLASLDVTSDVDDDDDDDIEQDGDDVHRETASQESICSDASSEDVERIAYAKLSNATVAEHVSGVGKRGVVVQPPQTIAKALAKTRPTTSSPAASSATPSRWVEGRWIEGHLVRGQRGGKRVLWQNAKHHAF